MPRGSGRPPCLSSRNVRRRRRDPGAMGTEVARPSGLDRALSCAALGIATAGLVLLRPSATLGVRLAECAVVTAVLAATLTITTRRGLVRTSAWGAVVVGFAGAVAMATLLGDAVVSARSVIGAVASTVGLAAALTLTGSGVAALCRSTRPRRRWLAVPVALVLPSIALRRATVVSHPPGFAGTPEEGHCARASTTASCARSSARPTSPVTRARVATTRAPSIRHTASTVRAMSDTARVPFSPGLSRSCAPGPSGRTRCPGARRSPPTR